MRLLVFLLLTIPGLAQQLEYQAVADWPTYPVDYERGAGMAVALDPDGNIWYYNRGSHPLILFSPEGKVLKAWKEDPKLSHHATSAHGMDVDRDGNLWLVDREANTIWKFSPQGRKLLVIGGFSGMQGTNASPYAFHRPADVALDGFGNVLIADGYRNTRVVVYSATGTYISHWGGPGRGVGQFNLVHAVETDPQGTIYVADRGNKRVQVYDAKRRHHATWKGLGTPWAFDYDASSDALWMADGDAGRITKLSRSGDILGHFGTDGEAPGQLHQVHGIAVAPDGSVYAAETVNQRIQKFIPKR